MAFSGGSAVGGAAQGASAGSAAGPWGAAVGAVVGGVFGGVMGGKRDKALKKARRAARRIESMQNFRQKVDLQQNYLSQRAEAVAAAATDGTLGSSATQGALGAFDSALNAEFGYANFMATQSAIIRKANSKADKAQAGLALGMSAMNLAGDAYSAYSASPSSTTNAAGGETFSATGVREAFNQSGADGGNTFYRIAELGNPMQQPTPIY